MILRYISSLPHTQNISFTRERERERERASALARERRKFVGSSARTSFMEKSSSSPKNTDEASLVSCWDRFKLKLPWRKRKEKITTRQRSSIGFNITTALVKTKPQKPTGGFRYDPLSYAQNFDDGDWDNDNEDTSYRGFSARFAAPSSRSLRSSP